MAAPVCPISRDQVIGQPNTSLIPTIPLANDLASALTAINALRQAFMAMHQQITINNTFVYPGKQGGSGSGPSQPRKPPPPQPPKPKKPNQSLWTEKTRKTSQVRVEQDGNPNNFVIIDQIDQLTMTDPAGETWTWTRGK